MTESIPLLLKVGAGQFVSATLVNGQSAQLKATVTLKPLDLPTHPLFAEQRYLNDVKVVPVWKDYTGKGVRIGQFEPGAPFQTETTTFDYRHPDLRANADQAWLASGMAPTRFSTHATVVAVSRTLAIGAGLRAEASNDFAARCTA